MGELWAVQNLVKAGVLEFQFAACGLEEAKT